MAFFSILLTSVSILDYPEIPKRPSIKELYDSIGDVQLYEIKEIFNEDNKKPSNQMDKKDTRPNNE